MFDNKEIGRRIRQIREKEGLNQEELAEKLDFGDRAKVYRIESGKQRREKRQESAVQGLFPGDGQAYAGGL